MSEHAVDIWTDLPPAGDDDYRFDPCPGCRSGEAHYCNGV